MLTDADCIKLANLYAFHTACTHSGIVHKYLLMYKGVGNK